jgi:1-acyl-sn-glycerol-3-phosphate acyltransferase
MKIIAYILSVVYYLVFGIILLVFHPIQWFCLNVFGYQAHKKSVDYLNFFLIQATHILGTRYTFKNRELIPHGVPLIIVCNHQSLHDIPALIWYLRKHHVKFVSKKELGRGIPSVSYNLRHGGSALIDRKDAKQALGAIKELGLYIEKNKRSAVIFPEGTRSKTGVPKRFSENGMKTLCQYAESAYIVPITINNSWKMTKYGRFPLGIGNHLHFEVHQPIAVSSASFETLFSKTEQAVLSGINMSDADSASQK